MTGVQTCALPMCTLVSGGRLIGSTVSLQGLIQNDAALEFAQAANGVFAGRIGGTGLLDKSGAGLLELTGDSSASVARPQVRLTAGMSALGARAPLSAGSVMLDASTSEIKPDGNNVTLEDQLLKMGQIQADFATMTNLYRKSQGLLQSALGRKGG